MSSPSSQRRAATPHAVPRVRVLARPPWTLFVLALLAVLAGVALAGCRATEDASQTNVDGRDPAVNVDGEAASDLEGTSGDESSNDTDDADQAPAATPTQDPSLSAFPYGLVFDPSDASRAYFTWRRGLLASTDGGATWSPVGESKSPEGTEVHHVIVDGTGMPFLAGPGTFRFSENAGQTWQPVPGAETADVRGIAYTHDGQLRLLEHERGVLAPARDGTWEVIGNPPGTPYGLWLISANRLATLNLDTGALSASDDGGATWSALAADGLEGDIYDMDLAADETMYAAGSAGLFASDDGGATWRKRGPFQTAIGVATPPEAPATIVVIVPGGNVYRSEDGGATWPGADPAADDGAANDSAADAQPSADAATNTDDDTDDAPAEPTRTPTGATP